MMLRALGTDGAVTGTGTFAVPSAVFGGVLVTADGTNNVTISVKVQDSSGREVFDLVTKSGGLVSAPIGLDGKQTLYYNVSGTNAAAQFYEWVE